MNAKLLYSSYLAVVVCLSIGLVSCQPSQPEVSSPDGTIALRMALDDRGRMTYAVEVDQQPFVLPSALGVEASETNLSDGFRILRVDRKTVDEAWSQPWGENKNLRSHYNELAVNLENDEQVALIVRFRLFDDGIGFRYEYATPCDSLHITDELTAFRLSDTCVSWSIPANYDTYELLYRTLPLEQVETANTPFTFRNQAGVYGSIHEAALYDFGEMTLKKEGDGLKAELAPWPDGVKVRKVGHFISPWRTMQVARQAVGLINSSLILNLNEPCALESTDWIHPMKYVGVWWGMHLGVESWTMDSRHGATTANALRYIDFAAQNGVDAVLFEGWNEGWESWGGRQSFDFTKAYADFDLPRIVRYAAEKNVQLIGHHETGGNIPNYEQQLEVAYKWCADQGIHTVKTGYAGGFPAGHSHHGQYGVNHYQRVVETAAKYHTTLDVHEPIKATGIRRTYPNMMTREGARGMEWNAWSAGNPPEHTELLPFTRLLAGPMDYTPGTFDILFEKTRTSPLHRKWNDQDQGNSRVHTTLCKQLANWVILYSPLQMASDLIENYAGHPAFQFFRDFNPDCDWSQALQGEIGEFVVVVRRAGDDYFLGATTNETPRTVNVALDFLQSGVTYCATIYADGANADWKTNPTSYLISEREVTAADSLDVVMASGGGQAVSFKPKNLFK
ncbi:MAG: glycoside hydrolase family 97 protein [Alistipes sp.]